MPRSFKAEPPPVRVLRKTLGKSQTQFAELIGISRETVKSLELGRLKLSAAMKRRIHRATGIHEDSLDKPYIMSPEFIYTPDKAKRQRQIEQSLTDSCKSSLMAYGGAVYTREYFDFWRELQSSLSDQFKPHAAHQTSEAVLRVRAVLGAAAERTVKATFENFLEEFFAWMDDARKRYRLENESLKKLQSLSKGKRQNWLDIAPPGHMVFYEAGKTKFSKLNKKGVPAYFRRLMKPSKRGD